MARGACRRGRSRRTAIAGTAAAPPTTRASTRSTSRHSSVSSRRADGSASTSRSCSRPARRRARRACARSALPSARSLQADVLIASDGPRLRAAQPTLFLGSRGAFNFDLTVDLRERRTSLRQLGRPARQSRHDPRACDRVDGRRARTHPRRGTAAAADPRRRCARHLPTSSPASPAAPRSTTDWGEPGLTPAERVFAWNTLEVLAFVTGNPAHPVNAIPPRASAHMQLRFVVGCDPTSFVPAVRAPSRRARLRHRRASPHRASPVMHATRLDPAHPWVRGRRAIDRGDDRDARPRSCRTSAARCRTIASPTCSACRRSGCRTRIRRARSTRRTSTCSRRSRAKDLRS